MTPTRVSVIMKNGTVSEIWQPFPLRLLAPYLLLLNCKWNMKTLSFTFASAIFIVLFVSVFSSTDEIDRLTTDLLKDYNRKIRPILNSSETLYVYFAFNLISINGYDDVNGVLSVVGGPYLQWMDHRLTWDPRNYSGMTKVLVPRSELWVPHLVVVNTASDIKPIKLDDSIVMRLSSEGTIKDSLGSQINTICTSDMHYYPFDKQSCDIIITGECHWWRTMRPK